MDRLNDGGRLILPLTTDFGFTSSNWSNMHLRGAVFLVTRSGEEFHAQWISPVAIFPCEGMRDAESEKALAAAFERGECKRVTRLYRNDEVPAERCWVWNSEKIATKLYEFIHCRNARDSSEIVLRQFRQWSLVQLVFPRKRSISP
ncbi:hypothetical protein [Rhizobium ruizarguesonis]|uniref:hypothetical protein n=1 Tax=Rhizobium ruizarguesonis TaxID=2081791 RepID=UPI001FDF705B|nr:hypothetical protein [Rhizobium ruizarguesonis]